MKVKIYHVLAPEIMVFIGQVSWAKDGGGLSYLAAAHSFVFSCRGVILRFLKIFTPRSMLL